MSAVLDTASWARRLAALIIDWFASALAVIAIVGLERYSSDKGAAFYVMGAFWLESSVGVALAGGSFGQMVMGVRVLDLSGRPITLLKAMLRQALVCLLIPPLVFQPDGRGLHDLWTKSGAFRVSR